MDIVSASEALTIQWSRQLGSDSHPERGSMIDSDIAPFTEGGIWESCLEEASIELSSKEYRSYLTDEIVQWPVMRMPFNPGHRFLILSYRG